MEQDIKQVHDEAAKIYVANPVWLQLFLRAGLRSVPKGAKRHF